MVKKSINHQLKSHPAVSILTESTGKSIFAPGAEQGVYGGDPHAVRDSLLTYVCHGSGLPCETPNNCVKYVQFLFCEISFLTTNLFQKTKRCWYICLYRLGEPPEMEKYLLEEVLLSEVIRSNSAHSVTDASHGKCSNIGIFKIK